MDQRDDDARRAERWLLRRARTGDAGALDEVLCGYLRRAYAIARRLTADMQDAEELVQEAVVRVLERFESFDVRRPFGPWFFRILVNSGRDAHRRRMVRATDELPEDLASPLPTPAQAVEQAELWERVREALSRLPTRQRMILWEFAVEQHSVGQIAESLGITHVTVRWHLNRGRRFLRTLLADLRLQ